MKLQWIERVPPRWRARLLRVGFNLHPAFRATGGRVVEIAADFLHIRIRLPLGRRTRNIVGSMYGGSLFSVTDGAHPTMLMMALGPGAIVWDKAAAIRYRKPATSRCMRISASAAMTSPRSAPSWRATTKPRAPTAWR